MGHVADGQPLIVVAVEEEARYLNPDLPVLVTGIGKINATLALSKALHRARPSEVVNIGTAGALRPGWHDQVHEVGIVVQHDFDSAALRALTGKDFGESLPLGAAGPTLATGDLFVQDPAHRARLAAVADLVDMEGYAVAATAAAAGVPVRLAKYVSDDADVDAGLTWLESLDECAKHLGAWVHRNVTGVHRPGDGAGRWGRNEGILSG